MAFIRGQDPKQSMGIGREAILREIDGIVVDNQSTKLSNQDFRERNIIIKVGKVDGHLRYRILKCRFTYTGPQEGEEKDLTKVLLEIREIFRKRRGDVFAFPTMQKVAAKTLGADLVSVQPMSAPKGTTPYTDYKYNSK